MNKTKQMQNLIRRFQDVTGKQSYEMREVVDFAVEMGWPLPEPKDPRDLLAEQFSNPDTPGFRAGRRMETEREQ